MSNSLGPRSTTDQVLQDVDLTGKRFLITGVSAGLGAETARSLVSHDLEDPNFEHSPYSEFVAYGRSKTANILFAVEFDRRHKARGVRAAALHPGAIRTELGRYLAPQVMEKMIADMDANRPKGAEPFRWKSIPEGAATSVWAACVADAAKIGGCYCEDCHVAQIVTNPESREGVKPYALDPQRAQALWKKSEELVGEHFDASYS